MTTTKILVVEDETPIREMIAFHLSRAGYEVVQAEDSRQARQLLVDERPDLALIDSMSRQATMWRAKTSEPMQNTTRSRKEYLRIHDLYGGRTRRPAYCQA